MKNLVDKVIKESYLQFNSNNIRIRGEKWIIKLNIQVHLDDKSYNLDYKRYDVRTWKKL